MEKLLKRKILPKLIIVEGIWGAGKTTFIKMLSDLASYYPLYEPDHMSKKGIRNPSQWYLKQHTLRLSRALIASKRRKIILERSILSSAAFEYAQCAKINKKYEVFLKNFFKKNQPLVLFFYCDKDLAINRIEKIKDKGIYQLFKEYPRFYDRYKYFYTTILPKITGIAPIIIKTNNKKGFTKTSVTISNFLRKLPNRKKIFSVCAAVVATTRDKVLLLYDKKYCHYVLPQGHQEKGEALSATAVREIREETGFTNIRIIKKIKQYQYHYSVGESYIQYKKVHVYAGKLLNNERVAKKLEQHEQYSNHFFSASEAIQKARWQQDKEVIKIVTQI